MNLEKLKAKCNVTESGCWEWKKSTNSAGYGQTTVDKKYWLTHRLSYFLKNGSMPGRVIRHKCHNRKCCNPEHLVAGSHADNWLDSCEIHLDASVRKAKVWKISDREYIGLREASKQTGISTVAILKHSTDGLFNADSYRKACIIAGHLPKI